MRLNRRRQEYESHFSSDLRIPHSDQCARALQCPPSQQKQNLWTVYQFTQTAARSEALDSLTVAHSARPSKQTNPFVPKKMRAGVFPSFLMCCFDVNIIGNMAVTVWPRPGGLCFFCSSITLNVPLSSRENGGFCAVLLRISSSSHEYLSAASIYCHGDNQASFVCYLCVRF